MFFSPLKSSQDSLPGERQLCPSQLLPGGGWGRRNARSSGN